MLECAWLHAVLNVLVVWRLSQGFTVLAFPCNQFREQEPGDACSIKAFVASKAATFPLFDKVEVNGDGAHPLYKYDPSAAQCCCCIAAARVLPWC